MMARAALLSIDTSTEFCSVALLSIDPADPHADSYAVASPHYRHERIGVGASMRVLPAVRELCGEAGVMLRDCVAVAFGAGPGAFTGLRIASGVAQGLAFGIGCPVAPVSTLMACAEAARIHQPERCSMNLPRDITGPVRVLAALDARMGEVYWADYQWDGAAQAWQPLQSASLAAPEAVPVPDTPFILAGNAAAQCGERLRAACANAPLVRVDHDALPDARPIARIALRRWRAGEVVPAHLATPEYVRDKVAYI